MRACNNSLVIFQFLSCYFTACYALFCCCCTACHVSTDVVVVLLFFTGSKMMRKEMRKEMMKEMKKEKYSPLKTMGKASYSLF